MKRIIELAVIYACGLGMGIAVMLLARDWKPTLKFVHLHVIATPDQVKIK